MIATRQRPKSITAARGVRRATPPPYIATAPELESPGRSHRTCSCGGGCPACQAKRIQAKLSVSSPHDIYEQEADRIADHVMRMPDAGAGGHIQRLCSTCDTELLRQPQIDSQPFAVPETAGDAVASPSHSLDPATREFMESRFGHDFGGVRVHTGDKAAESAHALNARAFTLGSDIVFGKDQYSPATHEGRRLIAHELAHVVQQSDTPSRSVQMKAPAQIQRQGPAIPAEVLAALAVAARLIVGCIIGAAFGVTLDYAIQRGLSWWAEQPFHWNTCSAIVSGIIGCLSAGAANEISRAMYLSTGGHLEEDIAVKVVVWLLTWLYGRIPVAPLAFILSKMAKLGCISQSELPPELQTPAGNNSTE